MAIQTINIGNQVNDGLGDDLRSAFQEVNAIMGGDNVFPDGPDVLTVTVRLVEDPGFVSASNPWNVTGRISWSESQA